MSTKLARWKGFRNLWAIDTSSQSFHPVVVVAAAQHGDPLLRRVADISYLWLASFDCLCTPYPPCERNDYTQTPKLTWSYSHSQYMSFSRKGTNPNAPSVSLSFTPSLPHPLTHTHKHSQVCAKYSWTLILLISETKWLDRLLRYHVCLARKHAPMLVEGASLELTYYDPWGERASRPFNDARFRLKCAHPCAIVARLNLFLSLSFRIVSSCQDFGSAGRRRFPVCPVLTG